MIGVREPMPGVVYMPQERLHRYVEAGELPRTSLVEALMASFAAHAQRVALCAPEGDVTYAELDRITDRFGSALIALGLKPLDRVIFQVGNCREIVFAFVGCLKAGLIPVCTLAAHREQEIEYLGCHTDARLHVVQGDDPKFDLPAFATKMKARIPTMRHIVSLRGEPREGILRFEELVAAQDAAAALERIRAVPRDPFQVGVFQLSGGTTGLPKVIPRMQNDYLLNATLTAQCLGYRADDVMFMPMPMIHNAAMICFWLPSLLTGSAFTIPADMTPEAWGRVFREKKPTWLGLIRALVPRLDAMLDPNPAALQSVRACWAPDAARVVHEKFGIPSFGMFGMSEGLNMYTRWEDSDEARDWTVGRPMSRFDEVRLLVPGTENDAASGEVGELACRGPYTLAGYYNAPERNAQAFTRDGFYRTGDLMERKEIDGRLCYAFAGRTKDVVDRGTEKINCEEVEAAVSTHEAVSGCAVVGMPDPVLGERVCAYLVVRQGRTLPGVADIAAHLEKVGLAKFKWPERIEMIDALPLTKVGKLDKAALRTDIRKKVQGTP
jgi:non-ribosomal peptide synthetase component E (peptide arylation enzyme)